MNAVLLRTPGSRLHHAAPPEQARRADSHREIVEQAAQVNRAIDLHVSAIYIWGLRSIVSLEYTMSKTCEFCGKHPMTGNTVSHAHNVNKKIFFPNLRTIRTSVNGTSMRKKICMKCLKAMGKT